MSFNEFDDDSDEDMTPVQPRERTNRRGGKTYIFDQGAFDETYSAVS